MSEFCRKSALALAAIAMYALAVPQAVEAQAVGYKLAPGASRVEWGKDFPLEDEWFAGGRLAITFGPQVELQPFYFRLNETRPDGPNAASVFGPANLNRTTRVEHAGSMLQFNFGGSDLAPFIRVGGGILRFTPDSGEDRRRITLGAGAGLHFTLGAIDGSIFAEQHRFRMRPGSLFGADTAALPAGESAPVQRGTLYGASLSIPLSSFRDEQETFDWLSGTRAPLEPFVGRFTHDGSQGLPRQDLVGVRTGIDFTSLFGIRGFYWRGVNDDRDGFDQMAGYGGEAQFNLNAGPGVAPYLVVGAGKIDFLSGFADQAGQSREDQTTLIVGGGVSLNLSERVRLNVAVRDFMTSGQGSLDDARDPDNLLHNRMVSAGFSFSLGGSAAQPPRSTSEPEERERAEPRRVAEREPVRETRGQPAAAPARVRAPAMVDSMGHMIVVPAPAGQGEIIIRYGQPGMVPMQVIRPMADEMARREMRRDMVDTVRLVDTVRVSRGEVSRPGDMSEILDRMEAMERRMNERMDRMMEREMERADAPAAEPAAQPREETREQPRRTGTNRGLLSRLGDARTSDLTPFAGVSGGDGAQFVLGGRADLGLLRTGSPFDLVPELSLATGSGRTNVLAMAHLRYDMMEGSRIRPYLMAGAGVWSRTLLGVSTSIGTRFDLPIGSGRPLETMVELQGVNFFDHSRLLFGARLAR